MASGANIVKKSYLFFFSIFKKLRHYVLPIAKRYAQTIFMNIFSLTITRCTHAGGEVSYYMSSLQFTPALKERPTEMKINFAIET